METTCTQVEFAAIPDAGEIANLSRRYVEHGLGWKYQPARIRELIRNKSKNVVVAREQSLLAGFGIMTYGRDSANLDLLAVKKAYRRRGVGKQIVQWLEDVALTAGIANVFVQVRKSNQGAIDFYLEQGFQIVEQISGYYQGRDSALIMCKGIREMIGGGRNFDS